MSSNEIAEGQEKSNNSAFKMDDSSNSHKYIILDTDMGTDDAWALLMILKAVKYFKNVTLLAITCVHGNTSMDNVVRNAYRVLSSMNRTDIPVYLGATEPLIPLTNKPFLFNGSDGMGDIEHLVGNFFDDNANSIEKPESAIETIHKLVMERPKEVSLLCIGPLTNIALAMKTYSEIRENIKDIYIMGGNYNGIGNLTRCAEFNFFIDPEAAHIVLNSAKCPITILPWEACIEENLFIPKQWRFEIVANVHCKLIEYFNLAEEACYRKYTTWMPCDAFLTAVFLSPSTCIRKTRKFHATVELGGSHTRGQMVLDHLKENDDNVTIVDLLSEEGVKNILKWVATA